MPPVWKSRLVIPEGYSHVTVLMRSPLATHPPSFSFGVAADTYNDVASDCINWINLADIGFAEQLHAAYTVDSIKVRTLDASTELTASVPGARIGADLVTPAVAALIRERSATAGRRGSGRMYWPGVLGDGDVDNAGVVDAPTLERLDDCAIALLGAFDEGAADLVLLHSYRWPYEDADPGIPVGFPAPSVVTSIQASPMVATQRRRQR